MENKSLLNKGKNILSSLILAVVLFLVIVWGINSGHNTAQAFIISQTAENLKTGLQYFYSDQNHFPSAFEFSAQETMLNYFNIFPAPDYVSASCTQNFVYKRLTDSNYQLSFCLPVGINGYAKGWNTFNGVPLKGN